MSANPASMDPVEFVRADARLRRNAIGLAFCGVVVGALTIGWVLPWFLRVVQEKALRAGGFDRRIVCMSFLVVVSLVAASVAGLGVSAVRQGRRVCAADRYPLAGMKVLRDTRVLRGRAAQITGRGQMLIGGTLVGLALLLLAVSIYGALLLLH